MPNKKKIMVVGGNVGMVMPDLPKGVQVVSTQTHIDCDFTKNYTSDIVAIPRERDLNVYKSKTLYKRIPNK